jgi:beta-glucanase (GH16 family)
MSSIFRTRRRNRKSAHGCGGGCSYQLHPLEPRLLLAANLVFNDDFNLPAGSQPNTSTWLYNNGSDPNNGNVIYTNTPSTLAVVNDAGATDGKALAMTLSRDPNNASHFLSSRINTTVDPIAGNFQYGHVEARLKLPGGPNGQGVGIWPAFWMLGTNINQVGWPNCGEIDIMENKGSTPGQIQGTLHGPGYSGGSGISAHYDLPTGQTFYSAYHIFAADWGPGFVNFLVDGHLYASRSPANLPAGKTWAYDHPFDIILDVADGGPFAGGAGPNSTFPQTMLVDYVRATAFPLMATPPLADADIGSPGVAGSSNFDGLKWTINGGGADIFGTTDQFHFTSESYSGDVTITARVDNLLATGDYAKAGIMIRDGTAANASYAFTFVTPITGAAFQGTNFEYRNGAGTAAQGASSIHGVGAPQWLRLARVGDTFTAYASADGVTWTQNGPAVTIPMGAAINVGLAADANNNAALTTAMFRSVSIVPAGWTDADIGTPGSTGAAAYDPAAGTWTVSGGGADIWGAADQFNFVSKTLAGNGSVIARVTELANTDAWAKAGVMLRNDNTPGAAFATIDVTAGHGVTFEWRSAAGAAAASATVAGLAAPTWLKLTRIGNSFAGFYSTDAVTWTQLGTPQTVSMGTTALAGLAVTAHDNAALAGAAFTGVAVQPTAVLGRYVFYNNSSYDGNNPAATPADDSAIAPDKQPLLPGGTRSFANFTSYIAGINGVIVDLAAAANAAALTAADFTAMVDTVAAPDTWLAAPAPTVTVRPRTGAADFDRIELTWADNSIQNRWLQITVNATANTGLSSPDTFYFGNLIGDANGNGAVTISDIAMTKSLNGQAAGITSAVDFNRNGQITISDIAIAKSNNGAMLPLMTPAAPVPTPTPAIAAAASSPTLAPTTNPHVVMPDHISIDRQPFFKKRRIGVVLKS